MPLRQARSDNRGLPPFGLGAGEGKRGTINSHKPSGMSAAAMSSTPPPVEGLYRAHDAGCRNRGLLLDALKEC